MQYALKGAKLRLDQICYKTSQLGLVGSGMANFASIYGGCHNTIMCHYMHIYGESKIYQSKFAAEKRQWISTLYRVFFFNWYPPKKLKYGKPRLGESTAT